MDLVVIRTWFDSKAICKTNSFKVNLAQFKFTRTAQYVFSRGPGHGQSSHWPVAFALVFLNHSCVANASVDFLGDMLFVFAKEDIGKSDEITINYFGDNKRVSRTRTDVSTLRSMGLNVIVDCVSSTREINNCNDVSKW